MIVELFTWLSQALTSSPEIAIGAAFIWGVLSVILSPCHIACIPLIVGFIDGQGNQIKRLNLPFSKNRLRFMLAGGSPHNKHI